MEISAPGAKAKRLRSASVSASSRVAPEHARRAAAPMGVGHRARGGRVGDQADLAFERGGIGVKRLRLLGRLGVAAAIGAEFTAVGHVKIDRQPRLRVEGAQPLSGLVGADGIGKMRGGRVARVAGDRLFG